MEGLGYDTRGPLIEKLKSLLNDAQTKYEGFLDTLSLFKEGKVNEREFFISMGEFLKIFSSITFLTVKVILELDKSIPKGLETQKPLIQELKKEEYKCKYCGAPAKETAKFCTKCGNKLKE